MTSRNNTLDPKNDIRGTDVQDSSLDVSEESLQLGSPIAGQNGSAASIIVSMGTVTVSGVTGMTTNGSLGRFITLSGTADPNNTGTFRITDVVGSTAVTIDNSLATTDANNGSISWIERNHYSLESDINYTRSDRANIKGVDFDDPIPTYQRPDAIGTDVSANLSNIAGKTTDASTIIVNEKIENVSISAGDGYVTVFGSFPYADSVNTLGYPISDGIDSGNSNATFVLITGDGYGTELTVLSGGSVGNRVFGVARQGTSGINGSSIEIEFRSVDPGDPISSSAPYVWEFGQETIVDLYLGKRERLDLVNDTYLRTEWVNGLLGRAGSGSGSSGGDGYATPTGAAGGDLSGTYPNPQVVDLTISGEQHGSIIYFNGINWIQLSPGSDGYFLQTQGIGDAPRWVEVNTTSSTDEQVKTLSSDTTTGNLYDKLLPGDNVNFSITEITSVTPLVQYFLNEASSGQSPTNVLDNQPSPLNLTHNYSGSPLQPVYFEDEFGRSLRWDVEESNGGPSASVNGTKVRTNLNGSTTACWVLVMDIDNVSSFGTRLAHIGTGGANGNWTISSNFTTELNVVWNNTITKFAVNDTLTGRAVYHIIFDSDNTLDQDRVRVYRNAKRLSIQPSQTIPTLGTTLNIDTTDELFIGNRSGGGRSPDGYIEYVALMDSVPSLEQIELEYSGLLYNTDFDFTPLTGQRVEIASEIDNSAHASLRQLIHLADGVGGPFEQFVSGTFRECLPVGSPFPTSIIWWESSAKNFKIVEKTITRNPNKTPSTIEWQVYENNVSLATVTDTITYSGVIEIDRIRTII